MADLDKVDELIARSSFGTPQARALRRRTSRHEALRIVEEAARRDPIEQSGTAAEDGASAGLAEHEVRVVPGTAYGSTIAKRRLSRRLAELRQDSGYTANQVCDMLDWGRGKVGWVERNQWRRPEMSDIRDLLRIYEKSEEGRREIEELTLRARARAWWWEFPEVFDSEFPGYENDAERIRVYVPLGIPGLLQTRAHIAASFDDGTEDEEWRARAIESRLKRQEILDREEYAPQLMAVVTEASLLYHWGTRAERLQQVLHLVDISQRPNVELRILRFQDGPPVDEAGPITILDFPGDEPSLAFAGREIDLYEMPGEHQVANFLRIFEYIYDRATDTATSIRYLTRIAKALG